MIDLRECTVLVNNETEYKAIAAVAKRQGFYWANNVSLDHIYCRFPTRLRLMRNIVYIIMLQLINIIHEIINAKTYLG